MSEKNTAAAAHPAVGKLHQHKETGQHFRVTEHLPKFDFGPRRGGVKAAVRIVREAHNTESIVPAEPFLAAHDPIADTAY